jgi:hypothetical protein
MKSKNQLISSINNIFNNHNKIFIHPIYIINNPKLSQQFTIIEKPNFDNSKMEIVDNTIYIKENTFTGLRGTLSLDTTSYITNSSYKEKILNFLSLFSGRLFELRYIYLYKYLPSPDSYVKKFFNNCCGANLDPLINTNNVTSIPYKYLLNKNKNIDNLKKVLEIYTKGNIFIKKYHCFFLTNYRIIQQSKKLNEIYLGEKIPVVGIMIKIFLNNYLYLQSLLKDVNVPYIIDYFTEKYSLIYYIKKEKILLKSYVLSRKIKFVS